MSTSHASFSGIMVVVWGRPLSGGASSVDTATDQTVRAPKSATMTDPFMGTQKTSLMNTIPQEILVLMLHGCDYVTIIRFSLVGHHFSSIACDRRQNIYVNG